MNNTQMTCDPRRIELFLGQQLSDDEQTAFESHLDDCNDCRHRLEATAASDDVWSGVRESLISEPQPHDDLWSADSAIDSATCDDASFSHGMVLKLLAPTDDDRMLGRLGTYEVVGVIGSGGMGVVLKAFDGALNRYVAIKVLAPHLGSSGTARNRFSREAQAAAAVVHENVIEIHGVADADDWREGKDRYGKISVRLVDNEIRGAWRTNRKSRINPGTPELADLLWTRMPETTPSNAKQERLKTLVEEFNRLMNQRRYAEAYVIIRKAKQLAPDETATHTMELKSRFAEQLSKARAQGANEEELQGLSQFPIHRMVGRKVPHLVQPPTKIDVISALERHQELDEKSLIRLYEKHAGNFRIVVEHVYDKVDPPRFLPGIGSVQLHRVRFKCVVTFIEEKGVKWPVSHEANKEISKVVMIDADHLHIIEPEAGELIPGTVDPPAWKKRCRP